MIIYLLSVAFSIENLCKKFLHEKVLKGFKSFLHHDEILVKNILHMITI